MQILRADERRPMAWKNGGGETFEVAAFPAHAGLDAFDWRISMARLQASGPFSHFAGVSRVIAMIEGEARLSVADAAPVLLTPGSPPLAFPGDADAYSELVGGPALDLNVMTRRGAFDARLSRGAAPAAIQPSPDVAAVAVIALGDLTLEHLAGRDGLTRLDAALWPGDEAVQIEGQGGYWLIEIFEAPG